MKNPLQLTSDARAVLLAAQLPDREHPKGFVREHEDVRYGQLQRGSRRLRELKLIGEGDSCELTPEGERLARRLKENDERLQAGIPFTEREAAIKMRGGRETAEVEDEWFTTEVDGQTVTTNGHLLIFGKPPSENKLEKSFIKHESVVRVWNEFSEGEQVKVRPVAYSEIQGWRTRTRLVWFSDGSALNADVYQFIKERYPLLSWTHRQERDHKGFKYALVAHYKGAGVAAAMPYYKEPSEDIQKLIEEANSRTVETVKVEPHHVAQTATVRPFREAAEQLSLLDSSQRAAA